MGVGNSIGDGHPEAPKLSGSSVNPPRNSQTATVILPAAGRGAIVDPGMRRWLGRADVSVSSEPVDILTRVAHALGRQPPVGGEGALRLWGQTGDRPTIWMAAADPVFLEARLDHLCLHRLSASEVSSTEIAGLFAELQAALGADELSFVQLGACGYVRGESAFPTATLSAESLHGLEPSAFMPAGPHAAAFHRLHSEVQMVLHASALQRDREAAGFRAINALWLWGGGLAPESSPCRLPALYGDDPLLAGYWRSSESPVFPFGGSLTECQAASPEGFVAVVPHVLRRSPKGQDHLTEHLDALRQLLHGGSLRQLTLLFADGITAVVRRRHRLRVWRAMATPFDNGVEA